MISLTLINTVCSSSEWSQKKVIKKKGAPLVPPSKSTSDKAFLSPYQSNFVLSLTVLKYKMNKRGFIFEDILPVINLVTLIHEYSYLISFETFVGYRKLRNFQRTHSNLSVLLEKPGITYPSRNF